MEVEKRGGGREEACVVDVADGVVANEGVEVESVEIAGGIGGDPLAGVWVVVALTKVDKAAFTIVVFKCKAPGIGDSFDYFDRGAKGVEEVLVIDVVGFWMDEKA